MSLGSTVSRIAYVGSNTTATYSFPFKIFDPTELSIVSLNTTTGVQTTLTLNVDYTVTGAGNTGGGSILLTAGNLGTGMTLTMVRLRNLLQSTDLRNQGDYYPEVVEDTFDQLVMNDQQAQRQLNSTLQLPIGVDPTVFSPVLPALLPTGASLIVSSTGTSFAMGPTAAQLAAGLSAGTAAASSAAAAATSQGAAAVSATNAAQSATSAQGYASSSQTSATSAQGSATTAQTLASQASSSATNSATSATQSAQSASNAAGSVTSAQNSATSAQTYASNSATSASNSANSASAAANSASQAQASSQVIPTGGTTGQILVKNSTTNYDTKWATNAAGITQLTGDATAGPGSGSVAVTIASLTRSKLATDTALSNVYNDANGNLASEAQVAKVRGGTAQDNTNLTFPTSGTIPTLPSAGFVKSSGTALTSEPAIILTSDVTGLLPPANGGTGVNSTATYPASGTIATTPAAGFVKSSGSALTSETAIILTSDVSGLLPAANGGTGVNSTATYPSSGTIATTPAAGFVKSSGSALTSETAIVLTSDVTGALPIANGGTALTAAPTAGFVISSGAAYSSKAAVVLTTDVSGVLPTANGGTGANALPAAGFVSSTGTALTSKTAIVLTTDVSGSLPIANGGTAATTATAALTNLLPTQSSASGQYLTSNGTAASWAAVPSSPTTTKGDLAGFSTAAARVPVGTNGQYLQSDSTNANGVSWKTRTLTIQKFMSGSGTYTLPTNCAYIKVRLVGGGAGGGPGGPASTSGGAGGSTTFGSSLLTANGGAAQSGQNIPSVGGTATIGTGAVGTATQGASGSGTGQSTSSGTYVPGGMGGVSPFGGAGNGGTSAANGGSGMANTGSGGGGAGSSSGGIGGAGGGAGGYIEAFITAPAATYAYTIGAGGTYGANASGGYSGGSGGSGYILVEEYY